MIIVAGGDSFIFGSELKDCPDGRQESYSRNTFTALLADDDYVCVAYPGFSNHEIAKSARQAIKEIKGIPFIIICWTWPGRDKLFTSSRVIREFEQYCKYHNISYLFTCADNCLLEFLDDKTDWDNWFLFPPSNNPWETITPRGFYQWAVENKYLVGPDNHPLEQAHIDASKLMQEKFNELVKEHIQ